MIGLYLVLAGIVFIAGAGVGFLVILVLGIHREEHRYPMQSDAPSRISRGARGANGLHVIARPTYEAMSYRHRQPPADLDL
jgi:hypothetical protein